MIRTARAALAAALFLAFVVMPLAAGDLPLAYDVNPYFWGSDLAVGYTGFELLEGRQTTVWLWAGGGWAAKPFYRLADGTMVGDYLDLATGTLSSAPSLADPREDSSYHRVEAKWQLGIVQGFVPAPEGRPDLVVGFLYYRGVYDAHLDQGALIAAAPGYAFADQDGIFQNSLLVGGAYRGVVRNAHTVKSGLEAEASLEWGPSFFFNTAVGGADFLRLNATARYFLPLYDAAPKQDRNLFSVYAGDFASVDWITGDTVPLNIRQSFGGLSPRTGLGGAVRGVDSGSLDGYFKAVNNLEVRVVGPAVALFGRNDAIVPGLVAYVDVGLFGSAGSPGPDGWGFVAATGAGLYVDLFNFAQITVYLYERLVGENADPDAFPYILDFTLKF